MTQAKEILFEEKARSFLQAGITKLADVVACTLGPKGQNVGLEKSWGSPKITNDGGSIVREIELQNKYENIGAALAKEVVQKMKEKCGDGTTTATLLLRALVEAGSKNLSAGASPISLKRGMDAALEAVVREIERVAIPVKTLQEKENVATVSASGDREVGRLIAEAMEKVGEAGAITIQEGKSLQTTMEVVKGMKIDRGYLSPYFCTDVEKMVIEMHNPQILVVDKKITSVQELLPVLQANVTTGKELLIIAEELEGDALATLVVNKVRGILKVAAIKAPGFGDRRKAMMEDIAALTGATVISDESGTHLKDAGVDVLGSAEKVLIGKEHTTLIGGSGSSERIRGRLAQIEGEIAASKSSYDQEKLQERRASLSGGVAVISVGAATDTEMKLKKSAFEDSLNSTRAAKEEGIVPGGGVALFNASRVIDQLKLHREEMVGAHIVKKACEAPIRQIICNAGQDPSVVLDAIRHAAPHDGFNANSEKVEDLVAAGVIDPAKVAKAALTYAISSAGMFFLTDAVIADAEEEDETPASMEEKEM